MAFRKIGTAISGSKKSSQFNTQEVLITLKLAGRRLTKQQKQLEAQDKTNYQKLKDAAADGDKERAKIYAQRVAEVRQMVRQIENSQMTLERIKFRLENYETSRMLGQEMGNLSKILTGLNQSMTIPELSQNISNVEVELSKLEGVGEEIGAQMQPVENVEISGEADKLLNEVMGGEEPSDKATAGANKAVDPKLQALKEKLAKLEKNEKA